MDGLLITSSTSGSVSDILYFSRHIGHFCRLQGNSSGLFDDVDSIGSECGCLAWRHVCISAVRTCCQLGAFLAEIEIRWLNSVFRLTILNDSSERLRVSMAGLTHDKQGSSIRTIHLAFTLASTRCFSSSSWSYFCLALLTMMHLSRVLLEGFAEIKMIRMSTSYHCQHDFDLSWLAGVLTFHQQ